MRMKELAAVLLLAACPFSELSAGQPFRFEGNSSIPLVIIDTNGKRIPDDPKIDAQLTVIDHEAKQSNALTDEPTQSSKIRIEVRGSSSQMFDKKSYGLETVNESGKDEDFPLAGLPSESDWILYGPHSDKSLMRNYLAFLLSNKVGRYAPRTRFVEVFLRDSDKPLAEQYVGVYLVVEKLKRGANRIDVARLKKRGKKGEKQLSGGYVVKIDRVDGPDSYFTSELGTVVGHVSPRGDRLDKKRRHWIRTDFSQIEHVLAGNDFRDPDSGYTKRLDVDSFVDYFLLNELFKNVDSYFLSTFLHKARDGKLHMGPLWDLNLSAGNASYGGVWNSEGWMLFSRRRAAFPFWWDRLFEDPEFRKRVAQRWEELRSGPLADKMITGEIERAATKLEAPQRRNFERWPVLGNYVWPNPRPYSKTYAEEIARLKSWFTARTAWIDENIEDAGIAR